MRTANLVNWFFKGVGFLFLLSCSSLSEIEVDVLRPAEYSVPPEILSVVVVDHAFPFKNDSIYSIKMGDELDIIDSIDVDYFGQIATEALSVDLLERRFFDDVYFEADPFNVPPHGRKGKSLSRHRIDSLLNEYDAQAVIALKDIKYSKQAEVMDMGDFFYATLDAYGSLLWKMYDERGYLMNIDMQKDTIFWDTARATNTREQRRLPSFREATEILAEFMGREYANYVAPYYKTENRYYYTSGHPVFSNANELVRENSWEEAAKVWYFVFEEGSEKQKARSALNLALSFEVRGEFEEAAAWVEISKNYFEELSGINVSQFEREYLEYYNNVLDERISEAEKLQKQIGG
ncbi:DUF6340 family protein [Marinilabiliaceae bacterium ANBcel2]|nr:DUF6340 family protein [Marinilabiliaceae bacterium ANBcel2]